MNRFHFALVAWFALLLVPGTTVSDEPAAEETGQQASAQLQDSSEYYELFELFVDTLDQVERNYVKDLSRRELMEAAIEGMLSKLDEHSGYIAPDELERFKTDIESEFGGIGIQVSRQQGELTIISPIVGSPAHRAGVLPGDVITHISGEPADDVTLDDAVTRLKGPVGTSIELTVRHPHDGTSETIELTREIVRVETVQGTRRKSDGHWDYMYDDDKKLGYLRVTAFARHTPSELRKALKTLEEQDMQGLILDLRFNPGGLLSAAIHVSDLFLSEGRIVSTEGRNSKSRQWDAHREGTFEGFPIAVLVNRYSASASEIVSASLQDHGRAVVIGERTFGKGSVQNIITLENGRSALKLTTAGYKRPSGENIHRFPGATDEDPWGVRPDDGFEVKMSRREARRLAQVLQQRSLLRLEGDDRAASDEPEEPFQDAALDKAMAYLAEQASAELAAKNSSDPGAADQ